MTERRAFQRKIAYAVCIVVLIFPLYLLSAPRTQNSTGQQLATLRDKYGLSQANLGEIDMRSEVAKLSTLGLHGLAVQRAWHQVNQYKLKEDWTRMMDKLDELAKLAPNFVSVWKYQAWNVSYNVSVEFDDYRDRYFYVRQGINFLKEGLAYNSNNPQLLWDLGWFIGQKIGKADEHLQYRRLFKEDDDYHGNRPVQERDNWLRAREWYQDAIAAVDELGKSIGRKSEIVFYNSPGSATINHAEAIEEEGVFGGTAEEAWRRGHELFIDEFGNREIHYSDGTILVLNNYEDLLEDAEELAAQLDELSPGLLKKMRQERIDRLEPHEKSAWEVPEDERTNEQYRLALDVEDKINVSSQELAVRIAEQSPGDGKRAHKIAIQTASLMDRARKTRQYRQIANYDYWNTRTTYEQEQTTRDARSAIYQAQQAHKQGDRERERDMYAAGFALWRKVIDEVEAEREKKGYISLLEDSILGGELIEQIEAYRLTLGPTEWPADFPLWDIIDLHDHSNSFQDLPRSDVETDGDTETAQTTTADAQSANDNETVPQQSDNAQEQDSQTRQDQRDGLPPEPPTDPV